MRYPGLRSEKVNRKFFTKIKEKLEWTMKMNDQINFRMSKVQTVCKVYHESVESKLSKPGVFLSKPMMLHNSKEAVPIHTWECVR